MLYGIQTGISPGIGAAKIIDKSIDKSNSDEIDSSEI
jgi:hypothetical protein